MRYCTLYLTLDCTSELRILKFSVKIRFRLPTNEYTALKKLSATAGEGNTPTTYWAIQRNGRHSCLAFLENPSGLSMVTVAIVLITVEAHMGRLGTGYSFLVYYIRCPFYQ